MSDEGKAKKVKRKPKKDSIGDVREKMRTKMSQVNKAVLPFTVRKNESESRGKKASVRMKKSTYAVIEVEQTNDQKKADTSKGTRNVDRHKGDKSLRKTDAKTETEEQADQKDRKGDVEQLKRNRAKRKEFQALTKKLKQIYSKEDLEYDKCLADTDKIVEQSKKIERTYKNTYGEVKDRTKVLMNRLNELEQSRTKIKSLREKIEQQMREEIMHGDQLKLLKRKYDEYYVPAEETGWLSAVKNIFF